MLSDKKLCFHVINEVSKLISVSKWNHVSKLCFQDMLKPKCVGDIKCRQHNDSATNMLDLSLLKNILERLKSITVNLANFQFIYHHQKCMVWSYKTFIVTSIIIEHRTHRKQNFKLFQTSKKLVLFQFNMGSGKA